MTDERIEAALSRSTEAIALLADRGAEVDRLQLTVRDNTIEISREGRALLLLPAPVDGDPPTVLRILSELVTFLVPLPAATIQRLAHDLRDSAPLFLDPLIDVARIDPTIVIDSRYATPDNCAQRALYPPQMRSHCFMRHSMAARLQQVQTELERQGYGLKLWDGYRPQAIQWQCVDPQIIPDEAVRRLFVSPIQGSNHGRGCAVDLTLVRRDTSEECLMPTGFDSPLPAAASDAVEGLSREQLDNRRRLHEAMARAGFVALPHEWWHFNYRPDGRLDKSRNAGDCYLVLDLPFESLLANG